MMPESRERKLGLLVLDARAAVRRFSKCRTLCALAGIAVAAALVSPVQAYAADSGSIDEPRDAVAEQVAAPDASLQAAGQTDVAVQAPSQPEDPSKEDVAPNVEAAAPAETVGSLADSPSAEGTPASQVKTPAEEAEPRQADAAAPQADPALAAQDGAAGTKDVAVTDATDERQTGAGTAQAATTDAQNAAVRDAAMKALSKAIRFDKSGTTIILDFNGDGKTDDTDWAAYKSWIKTYRVFDFNGDFSSGYNGGLQVTGGTQLVANGHDKGPDDLNIGIDVDKIKSYYLNNIGQATSVKNQSPFGSCWAFGATSALESAILKAMAGEKGMAYDPALHQTPNLTNIDDKVDLSELELAWLCYSLQPDGDYIKDTLPGDTDSDRLSCGGWGAMAETMYTAWQAVANEADDPYWPLGVPKTYENFKKLGKFVWGLTEGTKTAIAHVQGVNYLPDPAILQLDKQEHMVYQGLNQNAIKLIKEALVKYGAVSIGYQADTALPGKPSESGYFNSTYWAQYCDAVDDITDTHAVCIVGWDDNFDHNKFKAEKNDVSNLKDGAWLVKNSWGSYDWLKKNFPDADPSKAGKAANWGITDAEGNHTGYFWLSYYDHSIVTPSYFEVDLASDGFDYDNNYSYDHLINESQIPFVLRTKDTGTEVANVFTARGEEDLTAVSVHTFVADSTVHVRVFLVTDDDLRDNDPTSGRCVADFTSDQLVSGFHTVRLPKTIRLAKGQKFAVVENITSADANDGGGRVSYIALETGMAKDAQTDDNMGYLFSHANADPGTTYVRILTEDGYRWMTPQELADNYDGGQIFEFGNAMVKAFTVNAKEEAAPAGDVTTPGHALSATYGVTNPAQAGDVAARQAVARAAASDALPRTGDANDTATETALFAAALAIVGAGLATRRTRD